MKAHLTEKSVMLANQDHPCFTFLVNKADTSAHIKSLVKTLYQVDATDIRFINNVAKQVKFRGKKGSRSAIRKAIITLKPKQRIDLFDVTEEKPSNGK